MAPFLLTMSLLDVLKASAPSRIINIASGLHTYGRIDFDDLQLEKNYGGLRAYGTSKMALIMFAYELAEKLANTGVTVNCLSPGMVRTNLGRDGNLIIKSIWKLIGLFAKSPAKASEYVYYLAMSHEVEGISGKYFKWYKMEKTALETYDAEVRKRLWKVTERIIEEALSG